MPERLHIAGMPGDGHSPHPAASPRVRVAIADDHGLMRRSLRRLLEDSDDIEVLVEIGDPAGAAEQVCRARPDVLVLDLGMPDAPGLQLIGSIRERVPETQIVVVTMDDSPLSAQRALAAGAIGFVTKEHAASQLEEAVRAAARGEECLSPEVATRMSAMHRALTGDTLSAREIDVLRLIGFGHTSAEIAHKLRVSPRTVETHRAHIHDKLGLRTRSELVRYALRRGLLSA